MLTEKVSFIVTPHADRSIQLGIAEPAGVGVTHSPTFRDQQTLEVVLEDLGLPGKIASEMGLSEPGRLSYLQLVSLGFF